MTSSFRNAFSMRVPATATLATWTTLMCAPTFADEAADLAKQLANPIASLISVPLQYNYDDDIGSADGDRSLLNIQPVAPFSLNEDWNLISRTILPVIDQNDIAGDSGSQSGIGDILASLFFSPAQPSRLTWGVGPVLLFPTASDDLLGAEKWGLGPTAVALVQEGPWTYGGLANHVWSVAGEDDRADISSTFLQPFVAYVTPTQTTLSANLESSYDWKTEDWLVPINLQVAQLFKVGKRPMQLQLGARYWADSPDSGPEDWGLRLAWILLFPK